jgi:hypothetical protein
MNRVFACALAVFLSAGPSWAMGRSQPSDGKTAEPEKASTFGSSNPDESGLSRRASDPAPADRGGSSGSGTDTEAGPIGNNGAVQGANTGPTHVMGNGGVDPTQPTGEPGLPAEPVAPSTNNAPR